MSDTMMWYHALIKPDWAPPAWIFGPVWTVLYSIIAVTFGTVLYYAFTKQLPWIVALPFVLHLLTNIAFTPIQFTLRNNILASVDILLVLGTLLWGLWILWRYVPDLRWVVYANVPYVCWVSFAAILQWTITVMNYGR